MLMNEPARPPIRQPLDPGYAGYVPGANDPVLYNQQPETGGGDPSLPPAPTTPAPAPIDDRRIPTPRVNFPEPGKLPAAPAPGAPPAPGTPPAPGAPPVPGAPPPPAGAPPVGVPPPPAAPPAGGPLMPMPGTGSSYQSPPVPIPGLGNSYTPTPAPAGSSYAAPTGPSPGLGSSYQAGNYGGTDNSYIPPGATVGLDNTYQYRAADGTQNTYVPGGPVPGLGSTYVDRQGVRRYVNEADEQAQLRTVQSPELVERQLNDLLSGDSRYIRNARLRGREAAARSGMLMSSVAMGASERAAIESGLPIASQDAASYGLAARDNQNATNTDRLADQANKANFISQDIGIHANADESAGQRLFASGQSDLDRRFQAGESQAGRQLSASQQDIALRASSAESAQQRIFGAGQNERGMQFQAGESAASRSLAASQMENQIRANAAESATQRTFGAGQSDLDRRFSAGQNDASRGFSAWQTTEGLRANSAESALGREFTAGQNDASVRANANEAAQQRLFSADQGQRDRQFNEQQASVARNWQGSQAELQRLQERTGYYYQTMFGREGALSNNLSAIYSNPNLTAEQQRLAADNALAVSSSLWSTMNATISQGIPSIFASPTPIP